MLVPSRQHGFTLVELMIGLAIVGILLTAAMPSYNAWIHNMKIRNAADSILNGLQLARSEAVRQNTNVTFAFTSSADDTITAWEVRVPATNELIQARAAGSAGVTRTPGGTPSIIFTSLGRIAAPAAATTISISVPASVLPAGTSRPLDVTVTAGGNVRMCDPTVTATTDPRLC